jgi:diacylglycerol O-acyltransferase
MDFDRLRDTIAARLVARYRRFRQCAVQEVGGAFWEDDPDFDIDAHLRRRALPKGSARALQALASELAVQPLNPGKPLWRFDLIEDYEGGSALVVRIHHSIADGIALVGVVLSLTDPSPEAPPQMAPQALRDDEGDGDEPSRGLLETLAESLGTAFHAGSDLGSKALTWHRTGIACRPTASMASACWRSSPSCWPCRPIRRPASRATPAP